MHNPHNPGLFMNWNGYENIFRFVWEKKKLVLNMKKIIKIVYRKQISFVLIIGTQGNVKHNSWD